MSPLALMALGLAGAARAGISTENNAPLLEKRIENTDPIVVVAEPVSVALAAAPLITENQGDATVGADVTPELVVEAGTAGGGLADLLALNDAGATGNLLSDSAPLTASPLADQDVGDRGIATAGTGETLIHSGISDLAEPILLAAVAEGVTSGAGGAGAEAGAATGATAGAAAAAAAGATAAIGVPSLAALLAIVGGAAVLSSGSSSSGSGSTAAAAAPSTSGFVIDGLLAGATVFRDMNANRQLDAGEASTTSAANGSFTLLGTGGTLVSFGGTDTSTGQAFTGLLLAPATATVITPLTTLLAAANGALTTAELKTAMGLTTDPLTFNPFATGVNAADALAAQKASAQIVNVLVKTGTSLVSAGSAANLNAGIATVASTLATYIDGQTGVDIAATGSLNTFFTQSNLLSAADQVAVVQVLNATNTNITASTNIASANLAQSLVDTTLNANGYARVETAHTITGFAGTAASGNTIQVAEGATVLGTGTVGSDGRFSITTTAPLAAGTHTLTITQQFSTTSGTPPVTTTTTVATASLTANVDATAPNAPTLALATDSGTAGDSITNIGTVNVSGLESGATFAYSTNGGTTFTAGTGTSFALSGDGAKSVIVRQTDLAGNASASSAALSFTLDTVAPAVPALALGTGVSNGATAAEATAAGGAVTVSGEAGLPIVVSFANGINTVTKTVTGTGSAQAVTLSAGDLTTLTDGTISVSARQTDVAGNAPAAGTTSFTLDTLAPSAPALALGSGVSGGATAAEATAAGGVVTVSGESGVSIAVTFTNDANTVTKTVTGTGSAQAVTLSAGDLTTLTNGTINVAATQTDAAGNAQTAAAATTSFALDSVLPVLTPSAPADNGSTLGLTADLVISSPESLAKGTGTVSLFRADGTLVEAINVTSSQITITGTGSATRVSINPTADLVINQNYYIQIGAGALIDLAGNAWAGISDTTSWNFTGAGATVNIALVAGDDTVNSTEAGAQINVTGTVVADASVVAAYTVGNMTAVLRPATGADIALTGLSYTPATGAFSGAIPVSALSGTTNYTLLVNFNGTTGAAAGVGGLGSKAIQVDTVAPTAPTLALGTGVSNGATSAEATAAGGVVTVTGESGASIAVNFTNGTNTVTKTVTGTGAAQAVALTAGDLTTLTNNGTISVSATQTDAAGNAQTAAAGTTSFTLDTLAPAAPTLALGTGVSGGATAAEATAAGGVVTVSGEVGASIAVTFTNGTNTVTKTVTGTGAAQPVTLTAGDLATLTNGTISVSATQTDVAGNAQTAAAGTTSFALDSVAPTVVITNNGGAASGAFTHTFTFNEAVTGFDATDVTVVNGTKGTFAAIDSSRYSLLVTPTSSTSPQAMTVDVAAAAATDTAGNASTAAAQVLNSVLYGTAAVDSLTLGALADTAFLGGGNDVLRLTSAAHSTAAALDRVLDFSTGDNLNLSAILGTGGAGYSSLLQTDTGAGFVELKNVTLTQNTSANTTTVQFDIHFDAATLNGSKITGAVVDLVYNYASVTNALLPSPTFSAPDGFGGTTTTNVWSNVVSNMFGATANGKIALTADFNTANPIVDANLNVLNVRLLVSGLVSTFQVGLEARSAGGETSIVTANNATTYVDVGISKTAGAAAGTGGTGILEVMADTATLGTVGDNQLRMLSNYDSANNLTRLQISYDTNPATGTTTASSLISMDFLGDVTANLVPANLTFI